MLVGQDGSARIDVDRLQQRLDRPDYAAVRASLSEVGLASAVSILSTYGGRGPDLRPWLARAQINHDRDMRLQYLAGFAMVQNIATDIMYDMLRYRRFPNPAFTGSEPQMRAVAYALQAGQ
jgi:hypothetical protein